VTPPVGSSAPPFVLPDQHGRPVRLGELCAEAPVLLVFYPYAFSGVCTRELRDLERALPRLVDPAGRPAAVVAVSADAMFAQRVFADREGVTYPLLSDYWPHGEVARRYGVLDEERGCPRRATVLVDRAGVVRWTTVSSLAKERDVDDYVRALRALPA